MKSLEYMIDLEQSVNPQSSVAATVNGDAIERQGAHEALMICGVGAATGSPTSFTAIFKVQDSPDGSTWTDVSGATVTISADDDEAAVRIPSAYNADSKYRVVCTLAFVGGSTPAQLLYGGILLSQLPSEPSSI